MTSIYDEVRSVMARMTLATLYLGTWNLNQLNAMPQPLALLGPQKDLKVQNHSKLFDILTKVPVDLLK